MFATPLALLLIATDQPAELDPVVIHASVRESVRDELATSVATLRREELEARGLTHFADVMSAVPNLNWSSATSRPRFFQIRGIGERSQYEGAPNPSVGFVIDDIDFSALGTAATLFDVEQVEVLRGPQGTRYGANALAGLIYVKTVDPSPVSEHRFQAIAGDDDALGLGYAGGGPLGDDLSYRLAIQQFDQNGYRDNPYLGRDNTNGRDERTARAKLRWRPSEMWQLDLTALDIDIDNGFDAFAPDNGLTVYSDKPGRDVQQSSALALRVAMSGAALDVTSITTVADTDVLYSFDGDWGNPNYWGVFSPYDFTSATTRKRTSFSQELRVANGAGAALADGRLDWLAGLYVLDYDEDNRFLDFFNGDVFRDLTSDFEATHLAGFGQLDYQLDAKTDLTLGLRVERRDADYADTAGIDVAPAETMVGGQLSLSHQWSSDRRVFATLARGYKAGGFNLGLSIPATRRQYEAEYLWSLETGLRGTTAAGALSFDAHLFYARREDVQIGTSFQVDPADPLTFVFFTDNAARGTNYGAELDLDWRVNDYWGLDLSLGLLGTEFSDFITPERALDGREQAHAPTYQFALGAEYRHPSGWFARMDVNGKDGFYFSDSHDQRADAHQVVNLKLGYAAANWSLTAYARNVGDEAYATRGFFFGLEPPDYPDRLYVQRGDPRSVGLIFDYRIW